jgi:hypothetical protein
MKKDIVGHVAKKKPFILELKLKKKQFGFSNFIRGLY